MNIKHSQLTKALLFLLLILVPLTSCGNSEPTIDPVPPDIDVDYSKPEIQEQNLFIKGAAQSGLVTTLDDHSPFIILILADEDFRAYLTEQGVSEDEFLASPDLRAFYEAHVVGDAPGLLDQVYESEAAVEAEALSGGTITLESRDDEVGNGVIFVEGRETLGILNEDNTNYAITLVDRPLIDFPLK